MRLGIYYTTLMEAKSAASFINAIPKFEDATTGLSGRICLTQCMTAL